MCPGAMGIIEEGIQSQLRTKRYLETINDLCRSIDHDVLARLPWKRDADWLRYLEAGLVCGASEKGDGLGSKKGAYSIDAWPVA